MGILKINQLIAVCLLLSGCLEPEADPIFSRADLEKLNSGGYLDRTFEKLNGYDEIYLFGANSLKYGGYKNCPDAEGNRLGLLKEEKCELYGLQGINARITSDEYDHQCMPTNSDFRICQFDRYGTKHLVLWHQSEGFTDG